MPILVGTDGEQKMSKSLGNYIGIDEPAPIMFEKIMQMNDMNIVPYFTLLTDVPIEQINRLESDLKHNPTTDIIIQSKKKLAFEVVRQYHTREVAEKALNDYGKIDKEGLPEIEIKKLNSNGSGEAHIIDLLIELFQLKGRGESRRFIEPGAVKINGEKITNSEAIIKLEEGMIIQIGKKKDCKTHLVNEYQNKSTYIF
jgi:tyrosyl-tRNA synthetase